RVPLLAQAARKGDHPRRFAPGRPGSPGRPVCVSAGPCFGRGGGGQGGATGGQSAAMNAPSSVGVIAPPPRRLAVTRDRLCIEGHELAEVELGGWVYGPELGSAPVVMVVGGITATPFPFGDGDGEGWWPALCARDLIDPTQTTVLCPAWPGNGSRFAGVEDPE